MKVWGHPRKTPRPRRQREADVTGCKTKETSWKHEHHEHHEEHEQQGQRKSTKRTTL